MRKRAAAMQIRQTPWWLSEGEEECPHCGALYYYEVEVRCPECDGPSCPHCIVQHTDLTTCIGCRSEAER
jgi:hypothetical protein